jgi:copper chaperone CopZ
MAFAECASDPPAKAPPPPPAYTITMPSMHCAGCGKKIVDKLVTMKGVAKAEATVQTKTIKVTPKPNVTLSPKEMWELVEKVEEAPAKLEMPDGTIHTAKPKK